MATNTNITTEAEDTEVTEATETIISSSEEEFDIISRLADDAYNRGLFDDPGIAFNFLEGVLMFY